MDVLSSVPFFIFISSMSENALSLGKHMAFPSANNAPTYILPAQTDQGNTMGESQHDNMTHADIEQVRTDMNETTTPTSTKSPRCSKGLITKSIVNAVH